MSEFSTEAPETSARSLRFFSFTPTDTYDDVVREMNRVADAIRDGDTDAVFMGEHHDIITVGRHRGEGDVALPARAKIPVRKTERGGAATAHGPGQVVVYPVFNLRRRRLGVRVFVHQLEQLMIDTAGHFGCSLTRREKSPGVYADSYKVGSVGVRVRRGVSTHGLALNVDAVPRGFDHIVACGDAQTRLYDLKSLLKDAGVSVTTPPLTIDAAIGRLKTGLKTYAVVPFPRATYSWPPTNLPRGAN